MATKCGLHASRADVIIFAKTDKERVPGYYSLLVDKGTPGLSTVVTKKKWPSCQDTGEKAWTMSV